MNFEIQSQVAMSMLNDLHIDEAQGNFAYTCNNCKSHVETRYHCTVCDDFDLCFNCKEKDGHPHHMEKLGSDLDDGSSPADAEQENPEEVRKLSIQQCIQSLVHACECQDQKCQLRGCLKMKRVIMHTKICRQKTSGGCPICKQLVALCCYHANHCQEAICSVPFCSSIKYRLSQQSLQQRLQRARPIRVRRRTQFLRQHVRIGRHGSVSVFGHMNDDERQAIQRMMQTLRSSNTPDQQNQDLMDDVADAE